MKVIHIWIAWRGGVFDGPFNPMQIIHRLESPCFTQDGSRSVAQVSTAKRPWSVRMYYNITLDSSVFFHLRLFFRNSLKRPTILANYNSWNISFRDDEVVSCVWFELWSSTGHCVYRVILFRQPPRRQLVICVWADVLSCCRYEDLR